MAKAKSDYGRNKRKPSPVDVHVGARVKMRRTLLGMNQTKLGDALGVTFQQVQKCEKGTNRIGSGRLFELSQTLDVPIEYFFEDMPKGIAASPLPTKGRGRTKEPISHNPALMAKRETLEFVRAYYSIEDANVRRRVRELIKGVSLIRAGKTKRT